MARALIALTVCCACASGGEVGAVPVTCASFESGRFCSGTASQSELGAGIEDVRGGSGAVGRHSFCRPESGWNGRTVLFLVGTSGEPSGGVPFLIHASTRGLAGLAPMYEDALATREVCRDDPACYGPMRREVVFGGAGTRCSSRTSSRWSGRSCSASTTRATPSPPTPT